MKKMKPGHEMDREGDGVLNDRDMMSEQVQRPEVGMGWECGDEEPGARVAEGWGGGGSRRK